MKIATSFLRRQPLSAAAIAALFSALLFTPHAALSQGKTNEQIQAELKKLSIEELMEVEVSLATRSSERLSESASAAQVVSGEEIRRSGAKTLPEALRLAPNLQVAQQNSHDWGITARGFNGAPLSNNTLANKLLVMIDGRSVYTPLFGGVFWDVQNVLLEDIDRIEVISGPGGTLWGANAVNGIVNVVTKSARDTQGLYLSGAAGSLMQDFGALRYGGAANSNLFYRVYAQRFDFNSTKMRNGASAMDAWDMTQGGFRTDWYPSDENTFTVQGDFYGGSEGVPTSAKLNGQNVLARWRHTFSEDSDLVAQVYFDRTLRDLILGDFVDELKTYDFDFQHRFAIGERQSFLWGAGYRLLDNDINNVPTLSLFPASRNMQLFSAFLQDEITLVPDALKFTIGTKLEHNDFSGLEIQPSARLAWTPASRHTFWGAVSRAVRSPSRFDADLVAPSLYGNPDFDSEKVMVYELGYRVRPIDKLSLSAALFYNDYEDLRTVNFDPSAPPGLRFGNDQEAQTWGLELSGTFQATDWWRLRGGYTLLQEDFRYTSAAVFPGSERFEALDPDNQFLIQSIMDLPSHFQLDTVLRYVDRLPGTTTGVPPIPDYLALDLRIAWQFKNVEISLVGQNLLDDNHPEFATLEIPRSVYGKITWRF